ncbi:MAG: GTP 3',8-cyclase MoaA [Nannocystaceae bacterium]|nr:GTP 3',8-cyclase MoaA [Nannocystaceae bacterium]
MQLRSRAVRSAQAEASAVVAAGSCEALPLVDRLQRRVRYLRVSVTDRCNYRCTYCMPAGEKDYGPRDAVLRLEEVVTVVEAFVAAGVERVRLTGGEPTGRRGIVELVAALARLRGAAGPLQVVMTTNGETLAPLARPLRDAGLAAITVSLDSLQPDRFTAITRRGRLEHVLAGIDAALAAGLPVKTNTVAVRGFNDDELGTIARFAWARGATPRFIELMPMSGGALFVPGELMPAAAVRERVAAEIDAPLQDVPARDVAGLGPARYVAVSRGPWAGKALGTIGAMTENFCAGCNRVRLSATGQLHGCLGHDDAGDLRRALREHGPAAMAEVVARVLGTKRDGHGFHVDGTGGPRKSMISIGG